MKYLSNACAQCPVRHLIDGPAQPDWCLRFITGRCAGDWAGRERAVGDIVTVGAIMDAYGPKRGTLEARRE